ncbi:MAG TPA: outer membrane beta-barrel protein, partial [Terriglobales bacterium]
ESGPEPKYRGFPAPVTNPPFPFTVWPYGGSVTIGYPWTQSGPLMEAIWSGKDGEKWKKTGIQIYGWINGGFNVSTSTNGHYANAPAAYFIVPNSFQPDQETLYIERQPDTVQTDHFDWGFRITSLYGIDYRFTTAKGWFSSQLLGHTNSNGSIGNEYGYDMVMAYADLYFPHVAQGLNVRIGRYISLPDIEAQLAPNNYTYSHSLLYTYDAYTQTGINLTFKLSDHWLYQIGLSAGNDVAPWVGEPDAKPTLNTCVGYTWSTGGDNLYGCLNSLNSGKYAYNNLQSLYLTWYHKFNSKWHTATESWYMYQKDVPNVNNPQASNLLITNANGAVCNSTQQLTCFAPEWAVVNYVEREFNKSNYITFRNEYFDDIKGQRTGFKTKYYEGFLGYGHWIGTTMLFRPELRYEHSFDVPAYSSGTKKSQLVFASDLIFFF